MPTTERPRLRDPEPAPMGLAGGPQPSPPGVSDQTPEIHPAVPEPPASGNAQRRAEEVADPVGAERREEIPERRGQPMPEH